MAEFITLLRFCMWEPSSSSGCSVRGENRVRRFRRRTIYEGRTGGKKGVFAINKGKGKLAPKKLLHQVPL
jgi:hypothetical protein